MTIRYLNEQDPVCEAKVVITLIAQDQSPQHLVDDLASMSLAQIGDAIDEGDMVGSVALAACTQLEEDQVAPALQDIGNDGEFFNHGAEEIFPQGATRKCPEGRILQAQMSQGWDFTSMALLQKRFLEEIDMMHAFADFIETAADNENRMSSDPETP